MDRPLTEIHAELRGRLSPQTRARTGAGVVDLATRRRAHRRATRAQAAKRSHPMVALFRRALSKDGAAMVADAERHRTLRFVVQDTPGRFPGATRLVVVTAHHVVEEEYDTGYSAMLTVDTQGEPVQVIVDGDAAATS